MTNNEKRAHDLAVLYMHLEIKEEMIQATRPDDYRGFANEYLQLYDKFIDLLEKP